MNSPTWLAFTRTFVHRSFVIMLILAQLLMPTGDALAASSAPVVEARPDVMQQEDETEPVTGSVLVEEMVPVTFEDEEGTSPATVEMPIPDLLELHPAAAISIHTVGMVSAGGVLEITAITEPEPGAERAGLSLSILLPAELTLLSGVSTTALPILQEGSLYTTTWQVGVAVGVAGSAAVAVEIGLHQDGAISDMERVWVAVIDAQSMAELAQATTWSKVSVTHDLQGSTLASPTGRVNIVAPAQSLPEGATLDVQLLYDGTWEETTSAVLPVPTVPPNGVPTLPPALLQGGTIPPLPAVDNPPVVEEVLPTMEELEADASGVLYFDDKGMQSVEVQGVNLFALWEITAQMPAAMANGAETEIHDLAAGVLLRVDVAPWVEAGIDPASLRVWTREKEGEAWAALQREAYDAVSRTIVVWTSHFSQFGLGQGLDPSGDLLPSTTMFSVDELSGASSAHVAIEAPTGLGGMSANMGFSYNSTTMDDWVRRDDTFYAHTQASSVGAGWNLTGVSYIARSDAHTDPYLQVTNKEFAMVIDGQSVTILNVNGEWRTNPEIFAKVEWKVLQGNGSAPTDRKSGDAWDWAGWKVTTTNGTVYEFGDANAFTNTQITNGYNITMMGKHQNGATHRMTRRWYLRQVTDTLGNYKQYVYRLEYGQETGGIDTAWINAGKHWYVRSADPAWVTWSGHDEAGTTYDSAAVMQLVFGYSTVQRGDVPNAGANIGDGIQTLFGLFNKLERVDVQVYANGGWQTLKRYALVQHNKAFTQNGNTQYRSTLTRIDLYGKGASTIFQTYAFTYATTASETNRIWLQEATNSWGGSVTYSMTPIVVTCPENVCDEVDHFMTRHAVSLMVANDGLALTDSTIRTTYAYTRTGGTRRAGAVGEDGGFLGYEMVTVNHYERGSTSVVLRKDVLKGYALTNPDNPDPRRGRILRSEVWGGSTLLSSVDYNWQSSWYRAGAWELTTFRAQSWPTGDTEHKTPPTWTRLFEKTTTLHPQAATPAVTITRYGYGTGTATNTQFGNVVEVREDTPTSTLRYTKTEYGTPNLTKWIVNLPARVTVYNGSNVCASESRYVYSAANIEGGYKAVPQDTLLVKTEQLLAGGCPSAAATIGKYDASWTITRYAYGRWGNQTTINRPGSDTTGAGDIIFQTTYDSVYHLFPIEQYYSSAPSYKEKARYYGVNGTAVTHAHAAWGQMQEWCGVNNICTRQAYDAFGRKMLRWENQAGTAPWPTVNSTASSWWTYWPPGANGANQKTFIIREWNAPRCSGNMTRRHYNGFGELVATQAAYQDWQEATDGCGAGSSGQEIHTYYKYNGLGRQKQASIPVLLARSEWLRHTPATWPGGATMSYDALGRVTSTVAPNGVMQRDVYATNAASQWSYSYVDVTGNDNDRMLQWAQQNLLGQTISIRTFNRIAANSWTTVATVALTNDVLGNLTAVDHPNIAAHTTMTYDKGGRKLTMNDPDLGAWSYRYDRQGRLTAQRDAKGNLTCLYYDAMERVVAKQLTTGALTSCPTTTPLASAAGVTFYTYGTTGTTTGQVTQISRVGEAGGAAWYTHALAYNSNGLVSSETKTILGSTGTPATRAATLTYGYDAYFRPSTVEYPDNEIVTTEYNGMGLPARLTSSTQGVLVNGNARGFPDWKVSYDVAGRLTEMKFAAAGDLYRRVAYDPFTQQNADGGMLASIRVGSTPAPTANLNVLYTWDASGNVATLNDGTAWTMGYDHQSRLTSGLGGAYAYRADGLFTSFLGQTVTADAVHGHGVDAVEGDNRYDYDANGNVTKRTVNAIAQNLTWTRANELASITISSGIQEYLYDADGIRIRQHMKTGTTVNWQSYEFFPHYELRVEGATATAIKYYFFGGQMVAQKNGSAALTYIHTDHLGSTLATTGVAGSKRYTAYGATRGTGTIPTDYGWTAQHNDGTGLIYMHARYYDPATGQFVSPDTLVPNPHNLFDYNRYMYGYGNPVKYSDPSGHCAESIGDEDFACFYLAQQIYRRFPNQDWTLLAGSSIESLQSVYAELSAQAGNPSVNLSSILAQAAADFGEYTPDEIMKYYSDIRSGEQDMNPLALALRGCAIAAQGACGFGVGGSGSAVVFGARGSVDVFVDQNGVVGVLASPGAGGYVTPTGTSGGFGASVTGITNVESVNELVGHGVQFGASGGFGVIGGGEFVWGKNANGEAFHGLSVDLGGGGGFELHGSYTYSFLLNP